MDKEEFEKARGQFRLALNGVFIPFEHYGHSVFISGAIYQIMKLLEVYTDKIAGVDRPYPQYKNSSRYQDIYRADD